MSHLRTAYESGNKVTQSRMLNEIVVNVSGKAHAPSAVAFS